ncbi:MAG: DEAD/DEAH box helicase [Candidatus Bilamarchaeaceae archaeon]
MKTTYLKGNNLVIKFDYDPLLIDHVKTLVPGRRWDSEIKAWIAPLSLEAVQALERLGFDVDQSLKSAKPAKRAVYDGGVINIIFPYDPVLVDDIRRLVPGRRWDPDRKIWIAPNRPEVVKVLHQLGFSFEGNAVVEEQSSTVVNVEDIRSRVKRRLFPYQEEGVISIDARKGRALLADDMGLGKTLQAIAWLAVHPELRPAVVICPASLKINWKREIEASLTSPEPVVVLGGKNGKKEEGGSIYIVNYDILIDRIDDLIELSPKVLILDEAHYVKNREAKRSKATLRLAERVPHVIAITGTPILNRPAEIYNLIKLVKRDLFPRFFEFGVRYCGGTHTPWGWDFSGSSNLDELNSILAETIMIRRRKEDVLKDLPPKIRMPVVLELPPDARTVYQKVQSDFAAWARENLGNRASVTLRSKALAQLSYLRKAALEGKLPGVIEWVENFLESDPGKLVLFAISREAIATVAEHFRGRVVVITGDTNQADRQAAVDAFQNDASIRLFVGNIRATGVGLTLTAAQNLAFMELPWTPGELIQAEDRIHRIGQTATASIYYLVADSTIDEAMLNVLSQKVQVAAQVLGDDDADVIEAVIDSIKQAKGE